MDNNKGPLSWLKKILRLDALGEKKAGKYQYMLLVLCVGAAFMLIGNIVLKNTPDSSAIPTVSSEKSAAEDVPAFGSKKNTESKTIAEYEEQYETQMKKALEDMLGVDDVTVVVTMDSTDQQVLEKNHVTKTQTTEETDREGGQRKVTDSSTDEQVVIIRDGEKEVPIVVEQKNPEIRGVLVVAKGADNIEVKKWIREAVTRALGVPSHRVSVMPKK